MKIRIHFTVGDYEDYIDIYGSSSSEIQDNADAEMKKRGLDQDKNNCWSEILETS